MSLIISLDNEVPSHSTIRVVKNCFSYFVLRTTYLSKLKPLFIGNGTFK